MNPMIREKKIILYEGDFIFPLQLTMLIDIFNECFKKVSLHEHHLLQINQYEIIALLMGQQTFIGEVHLEIFYIHRLTKLELEKQKLDELEERLTMQQYIDEQAMWLGFAKEIITREDVE